MSQTPPRALTPFEGQDIRSLIDSRAALRGDHLCLVWEPFEGAGEDEGRRWSYAEFAVAVRRFAAGLQALGVKTGERVIVHLENCPESLIAWLGCAYAGAVPVTTNTKSSRDELGYFASHSRAVGAVTQPMFAGLMQAAAPELPWIAVTETDCGALPEAAEDSYAELLTFADIDADPARLADRPHDPWAHFGIQYTSGTTARPKAVLWTHANALWGARMCAQNEALAAADVHLVYLPLFHTNAQVYSVLAAFWAGATVVLQPKFSASRFWPVSLKHGATWTSMVPFCLKALARLPVPQGHSYRHFGNGICDPPTDALFGVKTIGWWGMTETMTHGTVGSAFEPDAPMSMGRPSPAYQIHVVGEDGAPVGPGQTGDLLVGGVRGLSLFLEYADDPAATAAAFRPDGLFITGDRVRLDDNGVMFFADRSKDMLKVGGENVAASEIERVIGGVSGVGEVAVVAKRHPMLDEVPVAFVIAPGGTEGLEAAIMAACKDQLASFKQPHEVRFVDSFPRATLEKVAKAELRKMVG